MRKLGNLTSRDLGKHITIPGDDETGVPERSGRLESVEHHYGDGEYYALAPLTTIVAEVPGKPHPEVWTYDPDWECTTRDP